MRAAHINADFSAGDEADPARGASDHDPQVARFHSRPALSVADTSVTEGDRGTTTALNFPVSLSRLFSKPLTVCASALPLTALPILDFDPYLGCRVIPAGATTVTFPVTVPGDRLREPDEKIALTVAGLADVRLTDGTATGTIVNDD
jgi:uncharacterized protein